MVQKICRDVFFLSQKSEKAADNEMDRNAAADLIDTLAANRERCVGMAANMIGVRKNIIVVNIGLMNMIMYNPTIVSKSGKYETEEGCLSLDGVRKTERYENIEVSFQDINFKPQTQKFSGWTAQIIQHEVDHLNGVII